MFGMGFMEIFLILIVAIMALGPEKLPSAAVDMVKFFKKIKGSIDDAKSTIDNELSINEMKEEANKFKASLNDVQHTARLGFDDLTHITDDEPIQPKEKSISKNTKPVDKIQEVASVEPKKENISYSNEVQS